MHIALAAMAALLPPDPTDTPSPPIYAAWQIEARADCAAQGPDADHRNTVAILVAGEYLVAPSAVFDAAEDFAADPDVCVFDSASKQVVRGRLVDVDMIFKMVLIRVSRPIQGPIASLDREERPAIAFARFMPASARPGTDVVELTPRLVKARPCHPSFSGHLFWSLLGPIRGACVAADIKDFNGLVVFSGPASVAALITDQARSPRNDQIIHMTYRGPGARQIRDFVNGYFTSGGRDLPDKPRLR